MALCINQRARTFMAVPLCIVLSACTGVAGNQHDRTKELALPRTWQHPSSGALAPNLYELANAEAIRTVVEESLAANPNLQQTALRLKEAGIKAALQRSSRLPSVNANAQSQRQNDGTKTNTTQSMALSLSWELDLWGRLADAQASAEHTQVAFKEDLRAAQNSLAGRIIQRFLEINSSKHLIRVERRRVEVLKLNQELIRDRYLAGIGSLSDLEAATSAQAQSQAALRRREETLAQVQRSLGVLRGDLQLRPGLSPTNSAAIIVEKALAPVPSQIIVLRPDLRAALRRIQAADSQTKVAYKALLPSFTLSANLTHSGRSMNEALKGDPSWNILNNLSAPIFHGGRLQAQIESAKFEAERAYWSYKERLILALQEVENALGQEASLADQQRQLSAALHHAQNNQRLFEQRYQQGLADILDLLNAQQSAFDQEIQLIEIQLARQSNRIDLGLALGIGV